MVAALRFISPFVATLLFGVLVLACEPPIPQTQTQAVLEGSPDLSTPAIGALTTVAGRSFCTGSLITPRLVLTAAHCLTTMTLQHPSMYRFRFDFPKEKEGGFRSEFSKIQRAIYHPRYETEVGPDYDIGVLVLEKDVTNVTPLPIRLAPMKQDWIGKTVRIVGYGFIRTRPIFLKPEQKYAADIPLVSIAPRSFLHQDPNGKHSACHGDSGGPALFHIDGKPTILGVTSVAHKAESSIWGVTYCNGGAISTRIDAQLAFLRPFLAAYGGPTLSCQSDGDCGSCFSCQNQTCQPATALQSKRLCQACREDKDCPKGRCVNLSGQFRCLNTCSPPGCCPRNTLCQQISVPQGPQEKVCVPKNGTCPPLSCTKNRDCGPGETCRDQRCELAPPKRTSTYCHRCYTSKQCGSNGYCQDAASTFGTCTQPCQPDGTCPRGSRCQEVTPGLRQCIPVLACFPSCDAKHPCPQGNVCELSQCLPSTRQSGTTGAFCNDEFPCSPDNDCIHIQDGNQRCLRRCGPPTGMAGSPCNNGTCQDKELSCVQLPTRQNVCLRPCQAECPNGGACFQLTKTLKACLCQNDRECKTGFCNFRILGRIPLGVCSPRPPRICHPGTQCRYSYSYRDYYCLPEQGDQDAGQRCGDFRQCRPKHDCIAFRSRSNARCFQRCNEETPCRSGACIELRGNAKYCMCDKDDDCGFGSYCKVLLKFDDRIYGVCQRSNHQDCGQDQDCPSEFRCKDKRCQFDPKRQREPFPEKPRIIPEEPDSSDTQDASPKENEPTPEPTLPEPTKSNPEPNPEPTPFPPKLGGGCQCQSGSTQLPLSSLLFLLALLFRRKRTEAFPKTKAT